MRSGCFWKGKKKIINFNRLTFEFESLQKVEMEQKSTIEKLSNNES